MKIRFVLGLALMVCLTVPMAVIAQNSDAPDSASQDFVMDPDASGALAEYFATLAHQTLRDKNLPANALDLAAPLYQAAMKLNPKEPRFARSLADIYLETDNSAGAMSALRTYLQLEPADQTATLQLLDVYLRSDQMQSVDQRLSHLRRLLQSQQIAPAVRSEIAMRCADLYMQRAQPAEAMRMLSDARTLNPLNLNALRLLYKVTQADSLPMDRVQQLVGILQANPADPIVVSRLAEQLAQMGLVTPAVRWYAMANTLYQLTDVHPDPAFVLGACSELLIANHPEEAGTLAARFAGVIPDDAEGWFIGLSVSKFLLALDPSDQAAQSQTANAIRGGSIALTNRLQRLRHTAGDETATTRPLDAPTESPLPDLSEDVARLKQKNSDELTNAYVAAISSLAWMNLYYRHDGEAAKPLLAVLAQLVPADDPVFQRMQAWELYASGHPADALPKLQELGKKDPLAEMGAVMIRLTDPATKNDAIREAYKLVNKYPSGVIGAVLWGEFNGLHPVIEPDPSSGAIATLINDVPTEFMDLINNPRKIYIVTIAPLKPVYQFGEPILVQVKLQNVSNVDLAIGDECAVHPELWFDGLMRGAINQGVTGAAIGRLDQRLVLAPGDSVETIVRVDQDALNNVFTQSPAQDMQVSLTLVMNPQRVGSNAANQAPQAHPGLCGYSVPLSRLLSRAPTPVSDYQQRNRLYDQLDTADALGKFRLMRVLQVYVGLLRTSTDQGAAPVISDFIQRIRKLQTGGVTNLVGWQRYLLTSISSGDDQAMFLESLTKDEAWQQRLLALVAAKALGGTQASQTADRLSSDTDPVVRAYALALQQSLQAAKSPADNTTPAPQSPSPMGNAKE